MSQKTPQQESHDDANRADANAYAGFEWLLSQKGLTDANLNSVSGYPVVPSNGTFTVNLAAMQKPSFVGGNGAVLNGSGPWQFWSPGQFQISLNFSQGGTYGVVISAKSLPYLNSSLNTTVYLGPSNATETILSTNYANYNYTLAVPGPGVWDLVLTSPCQGSHYNPVISIDGIQITAQ